MWTSNKSCVTDEAIKEYIEKHTNALELKLRFEVNIDNTLDKIKDFFNKQDNDNKSQIEEEIDQIKKRAEDTFESCCQALN